MADPLSIAGTAVGILSLGIQVCGGLFQYYAQFRGLHADIDDILGRVENLEGILRGLEPLIRRYESGDGKAPSQLQLALTACEKALQRLKGISEKCYNTKGAKGLQERITLVRRRILWPFKKETLRELQDTLNGFQDNLSLALQSLGLDDTLRRLEALQDSTTVFVDRTIRIEDQVDKVNRNISQLSSEQQQQNCRIYEEMSILRAQLTVQTANMGKMLDSLVLSLSLSV
jgi:hypothetical protein